MKLRPGLIAACITALLCLAPAGGRAPSLVPGAAASYNSWNVEDEPQDNALVRFLREHGKVFFGCVGAGLFIIFSLIMGPTGAPPGYGRRGFFRRGGFGSFGGFGGSTGLKNPWE